MPVTTIPLGRRQQKAAWKRAMIACGIWDQFKQERERLVAAGQKRTDAWDLMVACYIEKCPELLTVLRGEEVGA